MVDTELKYGDTPLHSSAETVCPVTNDLNTLLKRSAEKLLPLLGSQIQLGLFCASGVFPVVLRMNQIEDIVSRFFVQANKEIQGAGIVVLQTARCAIPAYGYSNPLTGIASHVAVTLRYAACQVDGIQTGAAAGAQSGRNTSSSEDSFQAFRDIVEEGRGFLSLDSISWPQTMIRIHLPVVNLFDNTSSDFRTPDVTGERLVEGICLPPHGDAAPMTS